MIGTVLTSCDQQEREKEAFSVEIMAYDYAFHAPAELPNGWITFTINNEMAHEIHELSFARLPAEVNYSEYLSEYVGAWEILLKEFQSGEIERSGISERANELLPEWQDKVKYINARGLVSPGRSAKRTIYLEPGKYALDCWVKNEEGIIHLSNGMTRLLTVTENSADSPEPSPESTITLHQDEIDIEWKAGTGEHAFALNIMEDPDGGPVHNNIHLIKIDDNTNLNEVNIWMDWYRVGGLRSPAPAEFLGGVSTYDAEPGEDPTYFWVNIDEPGDYAWIVQTPEDQQLWETFSIEW